jgi:putative copper export protein
MTTAVQPRGRLPVVALGGAALVAVLVLALVVGGGVPARAPAALHPTGPLLGWGVQLARLAERITALGTVGTLLFAAVLLPGRPLPAASRRAVGAASRWALAWVAATVCSVFLTLAQLVGSRVTTAALWTFLTDLSAGRAALVTVVAALAVTLVARRSSTPGEAAVLLVVALAGVVVPTVLTGHSAEAGDHLLAVTNLSLHVVAASVWVGGLLALLVHGRGQADRAPAAARFSAVALACFVAVGGSGLLAAWLVLGGTADGLAAAWGSGYGLLLVGKTAALLVLAGFGLWHRRRTLPRLRDGEPRSFRRFALAEVGVMLATVTLAVALAASPPPSASAAPSPAQPVTAVPADPMAHHDHGKLSVGILIDETRFHVAHAVAAGARVTVHNATGTEVTLTAADGSFDVVVPPYALITFMAPDQPGEYPFTSRHSSSFSDVLVVR